MLHAGWNATRLRRGLLGAVATSLSFTLPFFAAPAVATNYVDTFTIPLDSFRCGFLVSTQYCAVSIPFDGGARNAQSGDFFTEDITFDSPLSVPASAGVSVLEALLADSTAYPGGLAPGPYQAFTAMSFRGSRGMPPPNLGSSLTTANFGYDAYVGWCCDTPTAPYSVTGASASYQIQSDGLRPIGGLVFGYLNSIAATPQVLSDFQGGSPDAPVLLPAGSIGEITGKIGGDYPPESFYGFDWGGGLFQTEVTVTGAAPSDVFDLKLFADPGALLRDVTLNPANNFDALMTVDSLAPGHYKIGLSDSGGVDPSFSLRFLTPVGLGAVPEPQTWAMMLLGFAFVGGAMRSIRRRKKSTRSSGGYGWLAGSVVSVSSG